MPWVLTWLFFAILMSVLFGVLRPEWTVYAMCFVAWLGGLVSHQLIQMYRARRARIQENLRKYGTTI